MFDFIIIGLPIAIVVAGIAALVDHLKSPLTPGAQFKYETWHHGAPFRYHMIVDRDGRVELPEVEGDCSVAGLPRAQACARIAQCQEKQRARKATPVAIVKPPTPSAPLLRAGACVVNVFTSGLITFDGVEWHVGDALPDWKKLHEQYRIDTLNYLRQGNGIYVLVQGAPSGVVQFVWTTGRSMPTPPFHVVGRQGRESIVSERAYRGRFTRFLTPGVDYRFSFEVFEYVGGTFEEWRNVERDFSFVVNVPTEAQWNWRDPADVQDTTQRTISQIEKAATERQAVERAIDNLNIDADEKQRLKAAQIARQIQESEQQ